jgi:hypothetical protein
MSAEANAVEAFVPRFAREGVRSLAGIWNNYWFRPGGYSAIGISRVLLFVAVYVWAYKNGTSAITQFTSAAEYYKAVPIANYMPIGPVRLFFYFSPPPPWLVDAFVKIAYVATLFSIVGLFTRVSMVTSALTVTFLVSLTESWGAYPSAGYNVICLAAFAFMFGRAGDSLSIDEFVRRTLLRRAPSYTRHNGQYWWPVLLGQFAVALFYFGAFYAKFSQPDWAFNFAWAFSDNLRNSLSLPYNIRGLEMPWYISAMMAHPLIWQMSAFLHMLNQALPIAACFTRNPWARLVEALIFIIGCVALGVIMTLYNLPWIYLTTFFIDWDYFLGRARAYALPHLDRFPMLQRLVGRAESLLAANRLPMMISRGSMRRASIFAASFLGFYVFTIVSKTSPQTLPYPFSSMLFYSSVEARKPYDVHQHWAYWGPELTLARGDEEKEVLRAMFNAGQWAFALNANTDTSQGLAAIDALRRFAATKRKDYTSTNSDPEGWDELRLYIVVFHIPAYPEKPLRKAAHRALIATHDYRSGVTRTAKSALGGDTGGLYLKFATQGFRDPQVELLWRRDAMNNADPGELRPIEHRVAGDKIYFAKPEPASYMVLRVREQGETRAYNFFGAIAY